MIIWILSKIKRLKSKKNKMDNPLPLISIIVVSINNWSILVNCLNSLHEQDYPNREIIVVDNGSDEGIEDNLKAGYPDVRIVRLDKNYGFAGGNNRGIGVASGEYIALINNDATADPQWLSSMLKTVESDPGIGAAGSIVIDGNRPDRLDSYGVGIAFDGMSRQAMRGRPVPGQERPQEALLFSGCACLLRTAALDEIGLFDEDFFAYCEDTDLGLRLRRAGWRIVIAPGAFVNHYYSMTGGKFSLQKIYWVERNHFWVAAKNFPWFLLLMLPFFTCLRYLSQGYYIYRGRGDLKTFTGENALSEILSVYLKAYTDMFRKLPVMIAKRFFYRRVWRLGSIEMFRLIRKHHLSLSEILGE